MGPAEALALLEVPVTAGEDEIRRAYARRLRSFRPDEDPEGFQRLVQARDIALAQARYRARGTPIQLRVVYGDEPDSASPIPAPPQPPSEEEAAEPDKAGETASPAGEPEEAPAPGSASPPPAPEEPPGGRRPSPDQETAAQAEPAAGATERVAATPADVYAALQLGLKRLITEKTPFDVRGLEEMLLELPAGAGRFIEHAIIQEVSKVLLNFDVNRGYPLSVWQSLDQLGVMLTDHFGWRENDRVLFGSLSPADAARFEEFLHNAHEAHAPGRMARFARKAPPAAAKTPPKQQGGGNWWSVALLLFVVVGVAARMGGNHQPYRPAYDPSRRWELPVSPPPAGPPGASYNPAQRWASQLPGSPNAYGAAQGFLVQNPEQLAKSSADARSKLIYDVDADYKTLAGDYQVRVLLRDPFPLQLINHAAAGYRSRGLHARAVRLFERLAARDDLASYRRSLWRNRGEAWLLAYGWRDPAACERAGFPSSAAFTNGVEARLRKELQDAMEWAAREPSGWPAALAKLLELCDFLAAQRQFDELAVVAAQQMLRASDRALAQANLRVEIGTILRCMVPGAGQK